MVSLGYNFNMNTGAQYMDGDNTNESGSAAVTMAGLLDNDRQELLDPVLATNSDDTFKKLRTTPIFSIHLLISTVISLVGVLLAATWPPGKRCDAYFIMLYLRAAFWFITFLFDHVVKKHHDDLRMNGYHEFHRSTAVHKGVPLYIVSLWNSTILAVQALMQHFYGDHFGEHCIEKFFSPIVYITLFNMLESIVFALVHGSYILKVSKFNKARHPPDALRGANTSSGSLGLMQPGGNVAELLEKQADLIAYYKDHNLELNQKLMLINAYVNRRAHDIDL